ncbi:MAG: DNA topoisomerase IV subunit A, partial [Candidatus Accumulibacter sp.]|nr:DNA topoisomerase IV subunit A [Accumulibacter sp.]
LFARTSGHGFVCAFGDLLSRQKTGKAFMMVEDGAAILPPALVGGKDHVAALSSGGRLLVFPLDQMKRLSGGKGVRIIALRDGETLASAIAIAGSVVRVTGISRNRKKNVFSDERHLGQRARRGVSVGVNDPTIHPPGPETN